MYKILNPLVMMQLKDKMDLSFRASTKKTISKVVLSIVQVIVTTAIIFALFYISKLLGLFHLADIIPVSLIVVIFTIMEIVSILACVFGLMKSLFFSKDNMVLLTLPVTTTQVYLSKLIVYYIYELMKNIYFLFPLFLAYGLISGFSFVYYIWLPICLVIISLVPISIASVFSIVAMLISIFLKNVPILKILLFLTLVGLGIWGVVTIIKMIPADLDIVGSWGTIFWTIQDFLNGFVEIFYPFAKLTQLVVGTYVGLKPQLFSLDSVWIFLSTIAFIAILIGLSFVISRPLFFKMASKSFEYRKKNVEKAYKNQKNNPIFSSLKKELLIMFRSSSENFSLLGVVISMPILILLLNQIFASISTRSLGDYMTISFNLLIIMLIAMASNANMASVYSRDGNTGYLMKIMPNKYYKGLLPKLVINAILVSISIIISVIVFSFFNGMSTINTILFGATAILIYLMHLLWSAEMDIMNPQNAQYATTGSHINNPNETKSTVATFFISILFFVITLFLSIENIHTAWIKVSIMALVILIYRIWSFFSKIKYYYKEK